jgi:hypothetical protein
MAGTIAQQPLLMGQVAVETAVAAASGQAVEPFVPIETTLVTADNVGEFMAPATDGSTTTPPGPVAVDTTLTCTYTLASSADEGVVQQLRGGEFTCDMTADDARLTGTVTVQVNCDCTAVGCSCWGTTDGPQNEGGGWVGFFASVEPDSAAPATVWVSEGTGANEGWTWVLNHQPAGDMVWEGTAMLYQGAPPLWAPLPSTE